MSRLGSKYFEESLSMRMSWTILILITNLATCIVTTRTTSKLSRQKIFQGNQIIPDDRREMWVSLTGCDVYTLQIVTKFIISNICDQCDF